MERRWERLAVGCSHPHQSPAPLSTSPCNIHPEPGRHPSRQTGRVYPEGACRSSALNLLHASTSVSVKPCCDYQNLVWGGGAFSPTLPLAQRANVPLKMHIFAAHLAYLMHMHHTLGTKRNDIASDTEHPSSDIQFAFLQRARRGWGGWGEFSPKTQSELWESVKQKKHLLKDAHLDAA